MARWKDTAVAPTHDVVGNLHFSPYGVFAYWIITPPLKPLANSTKAAAAAAAHRQLSELLPLKPGFAGTSSLKSARFIYDQQVKTVDVKRFPLYERIAAARADQAAATKPRYTSFWMWVRLESPGSDLMGRVRDQLSAGSGLFAAKPTAGNVDRYWQQMLEVERRIPKAFVPLRPTPQQVRWFYRRHHTLGVVDEPLPLPEHSATQGYRWEPMVDLEEHGMSPVLKVVSMDDGQVESFRVSAVVTSMPAGGIYFPASDITAVISSLEDADGEAVRCEWVQLADSKPLREVNRNNQKSLRKINDQYDQQAGRRSTQKLVESEAALAEYEQELSAEPREAEVVYTTVFTVGAPTRAKAEAGYEALREALAGLRVDVNAPVGLQKRLYQASRPGRRDDSVRKGFAQYTTRTGWSGHIPLTSTRIGDADGRPIGLNLRSGDLDFVFLNARGAARRVQSGGMIVGGDPRKGKTHFQMLNAAEEAVSGACVAMFDASPGRQWRRFAESVPNAAAIDLADGECTVDPLVTIGGRRGAELLAGELLRIGGEDPSGEAGAELRLLLAQKQWRSAGELLETVASDGVPEPLRRLGRRLQSWAATATGEALFGRRNEQTGRYRPLPKLALDEVSLLVVDTNGLGLPTEAEMAAASAGTATLEAQQVIAQSVMSLFAVYLREVFYGRPSRDILGFDEGWRTVGVKVLKDLVFEILRTGPAANVDVWLNSQRPWVDFADIDEDLARVRVMFGVEGELAAPEAARWMGIDPAIYPSVVETIRTGLSPRTDVGDPFHRSAGQEVIERDRMGECLIRMGDGTFGWVKTFEMVFTEWEAAADTRPVAT